MLYVTACLWDRNDRSYTFSHCYDESWVEKLYRGFARNLTQPFRFVCFTDRLRTYREPIINALLESQTVGYGCCIEPFKLDKPMIFCGLDTIVTGNIDHMADYCLKRDAIALPRDPYRPERSINGVALVPSGFRFVFDEWRGENDMEWLRRFPVDFIDDVFPNQVRSFKAHGLRKNGLGAARIVYFHGVPKPHQLGDVPWIAEHWR